MVKFEEIMKHDEYRERFIKYFNYPIRLSVSKDKFESSLEFMKQIDNKKYLKAVEMTEHDFNKAIHEQGSNTPDFSMNHILESILSTLESNPKWQQFLKEDNSDILADYNGIKNTHNFYTKENDGKHFISIDLTAANWQSLQSILGLINYEDFIDKYTNNLIPKYSKAFRTKITGKLGAKNIMNYNKKFLMENKDSILESIYKETGVNLLGETLFAFYADEFLIEIDENTKSKLDLVPAINLEGRIYEDTGVKIHFTPFTLKWLNVNKGCAKVYYGNKYKLINLSKDIALIMDKLSYDLVPKEIDFEGIKLGKESREEFIERLETSLKSIYVMLDM